MKVKKYNNLRFLRVTEQVMRYVNLKLRLEQEKELGRLIVEGLW